MGGWTRSTTILIFAIVAKLSKITFWWKKVQNFQTIETTTIIINHSRAFSNRGEEEGSTRTKKKERKKISHNFLQNHYDDHFYLQINRNDEWEDLLNSFGIEEATANGSLALKQTYLRYLDPYEKVHFLGEEEDDRDDWVDEEDSRFVHIIIF